VSKIRDFFKRITGISTPFGGISWSQPDKKVPNSSAPTVGQYRLSNGETNDYTKTMSDVLDAVAKWPKMDRCQLVERMRKHIEGFPDNLKIMRCKTFLASEKKLWTKRLEKIEAESEKNLSDFQKDPQHAGKQFAFALSKLQGASPKSVLDLIDQLEDEIEFCEANNLSCDVAVQKAKQIADPS
jgi:hypothetical protein